MVVAPNPFDEVPYAAGSEPRTRPDRLALISWHRGGPRPSVEGYRLLELGCGTGANLIPLAFYDPESAYLGVDASAAQIQQAQAAVATLGLSNIRFIHADLREIPGQLDGPFDYVIAHGVFSWVPADAREAILEVAAHDLEPEGLAYVSYNVYPGWKAHEVLRNILLAASSGRASPRELAERSRALTTEIMGTLPPEGNDPWTTLLRRELREITEGLPFYVLHDHLSQDHAAFEYRDFVSMAAAHDLTILGDADAFRVQGPRERLEAVGLHGIELEQTLDLIANRRFRASVLCRRNARRNAPLGPSRIGSLFAAAALLPTSDAPSLADGVEIDLEGLGGIRHRLRDVVGKALMVTLADAYPTGMAGDAVVANAASRFDGGIPSHAWYVRLLTLSRDGLVDLRLREPALAAAGTAAHALARLEAKERPHLTTPWHSALFLDDLGRHVLLALDGTRTPDTVVEGLLDSLARGEIRLPEGGELEPDPETGIEPVIRAAVDITLATLGRWGLLAAATGPPL